MSKNNAGKRFGRYLLLDHLVDGGMASIMRARFLGDGVARIVAIKMMHQKYTSDKYFKIMFMDEIKVTLGLVHPNIVQIYDYGERDNNLFVSLEYCDGKNIKQFLDKLKIKKYVFPVEISVHIITQMCQGLYYAHTFVDKLTGKKANIVHRDISPHNVMITYDGSVKIIDFGIAKAESNSEATQAGTIKGKLSYLAPEYIDGQEQDHRYDQFAVGITLWELLCNRKLFTSKTDLGVIKKIQECKIPTPSSINPNIPKELDEIVLKTLSKNREDRYKNMDQLNRALNKFLYANYPDFNASDLGYFAKDLFKEEIVIDREKLFEFGKIDVEKFVNDWKNEQAEGTNNNSERKKERVKKSSKSKRTKDFEFSDESITIARKNRQVVQNELTSGKKYDLEIEPSIRSSTNINVASITKGAKGIRSKSNSKKNENIGENEFIEVEKTLVDINISKVQNKKSYLSFVGVLAIVGGLWLGKDFILKNVNTFDTITITDSKKQKKVVKIKEVQKLKNKKIENKRKRVIANIKSRRNYSISFQGLNSFKHKVYINNKVVKVDYLNKISLESNRNYSVRIEQSGKIPKIFNLNDLNKNHLLKIEKLKSGDFVHLYMSNNCVKGQIFYKLYGEDRIANLPITKKNYLSFPFKGDGRIMASEDNLPIYQLYLKEKGKNVQKNIKFEISTNVYNYDFCELL